jgi:amidohydrolase
MNRIGFFLLTAALAFMAAPAAFGVNGMDDKTSAARAERVAREAEGLRAKLVEQRRDFHMHPELSNREERTARVVAERLRALGLTDIRTGVAKHGVTALLVGGRPGPVVALRADMDALPINETLDVPYKSRYPGVKHACGHDVHTTAALGVAEVLSRMRSEVPGTVKFIFQPAEEGPPAGEEGGAPLMIKEGALENPRPAAIFGLHTEPNLQAGQIGYHSGPAMASSDTFEITVRGKKAHGAQPHAGVDAVVVASEAVLALQHIRSRRVDPLEPLVLTVGTIQGGDRFNVIAGEVRMTGTLRALNNDVRERVKGLMRETLQSVTAAYGATFELKFDGEGNPVTYNEPLLVEETLPTIRRVVGAQNAVALRPFMPAEDFSYFQKVVPGFYYFLGVGNRAKGITAGWHTAEFDVDEESLVVGVKVMTNVLLDYLERRAGEMKIKSAASGDGIGGCCVSPDCPKPAAASAYWQPEARNLWGAVPIKYKSKPQPAYPEDARAARATGQVRVEVVFDEEGKVIWAKAGHGHALLQQAALKAACEARFYPAYPLGQTVRKPVKAADLLTYSFALQ